MQTSLIIATMKWIERIGLIKVKHTMGRNVNLVKNAYRYFLFMLILLSVFTRMFVGVETVNWNRLTYYTIITNLLMGAYWFIGATWPELFKKASFEKFRLMCTVAIALTGILYFVFLHKAYVAVLGTKYLQGETGEIIYQMDTCITYTNHLLIPLLAFLDYVFVAPHVKLKTRSLFLAMTIPIGYFVIHSSRGLLTGYYLYTFIDPSYTKGWGLIIALTASVCIFAWFLALLMTSLVRNKIIKQEH